MSKLINTEVLEEEPITLDELKKIIEKLSSSEDIWVTMYDSDESYQNYVQMHSVADDFGKQFIRSEDKAPFLNYLAVVEGRVYEDDNNNFKHYRIFSRDFDYIFSVFEASFNNQPIDYSTWQDVTNEFDD